MVQTIYASFADSAMGEKAAGALLDFGANPEDVCLVGNSEQALPQVSADAAGPDVSITEGEGASPHVHSATLQENIAKHGITTTTAADAECGAVKGAGIGLVLGALAAFAVPGIGWAIGGGALAAALSATALATGAGAIAGGVTGYLKDQGVPNDVAEKYHGKIQGGGALLTLHLPSGKVDQQTAEEIIEKYQGEEMNSYRSSASLLENA